MIDSSRHAGGLRRLYRDLWRQAEGRRAMLAAALDLLRGSQLLRLGVPYLSGRAMNALQLRGLGGQRQRVALARGVLAANGSGLVPLDEPTAALDPATERRVYDNLFAAFPGACIVSSVHRLNLLDHFDEVLLMASGRLIAQGPPAELAQASEAFRTLRAAQRKTETA
jgi:ABC-type protease/lipase transport system fused ATPase/permease subunit